MHVHTSASDSSQAFEPLFATPNSDDLSSYVYRQLIGSLGLVLPVMLWLIAGLRPTEGLPRWELLGSVSAYYYTGAVAAFVGILVALGVFLFTYHGYNNSYRRHDRIAGIVAGATAILVAFFPTRAPKGLSEPSWWIPRTGTIHYISAVGLFCAFSYFSLFLFTKSNIGKDEKFPLDKLVRNWIYIFCGIAMVGCMLWTVSASIRDASIFVPEALALEFFAVSWLVKGRADRTAAAVGRRTLYYGLHPGKLVRKVWGAFAASGLPSAYKLETKNITSPSKGSQQNTPARRC